MKSLHTLFVCLLLVGPVLPARTAYAGQATNIYGIFGYDPSSGDDPRPYLNHIYAAGPGWVTISVVVGSDPNNVQNIGAADLTWLSNDHPGNTIVCRLNNGYFPSGTIPLPASYDDFAKTCAKFVQSSRGCSIWTIGNEVNVQCEWPYIPSDGRLDYVSPTNYATCFLKVYDAIKAVHPNDVVLPEGPAAGSGGGPANAGVAGCGSPADAQPYTWVQHLNLVLQAILNLRTNTTAPDGICLHIPAQGYACSDIHSTSTFAAGGQTLYSDFYAYKDAVNLGIPASLRGLPLYATECNGNQSWNNYQAGWMQGIYDEINHYNQWAFSTNGPVFRCVNMYRWCCGDASQWWIQGSTQASQILSDLDQAVARKYVWPTSASMLLAPIGLNFVDPPSNTANDSVNSCNGSTYRYPGVAPQDDWINLTAGGAGTSVPCGGGVTVTWSTPGGGTHTITSQPVDGGNSSLMRGYLDTGNATTDTVTVSGLKFLLYDVIAYSDGDNGSAARVTKFTLSGSGITTISKYVQDAANVNFSGTFIEADSTTGGASTPAGNYVRFHNLRPSSFTITSTGDYASDPNPRGPFNALQIVPIDVRPTLSNPGFGNGQFQCFLSGATNFNYTIQASTDLIHWTPVSTNSAPGLLTLPPSVSTAYRFYRALFQ